MGRTRRSHRDLPERMYLRSGTYYFVEYVSNKWINLGRNYVKAMAEYARLRGPNGPLSTMDDLIDRYMIEVAPQKAENTYKGNLREAKYLKAAFGKVRPSDIKPKSIYAYLDERGRSSEVRANREIALLSHIFTKSIRWGAVETNPCLGIERFKERPRMRYVEDNEYLAFKNFAGEFLSLWMDFKLLTGLRQGDMLALRLDQLKPDGIHIDVKKTGKPQIIEWSTELRSTVDRIRRLPRPVRGLHLFSTRRGRAYTRGGFSSIWKRKMKRALDEGVLHTRFTENDLRTKTGSDTDLEHATKLLGHASSRVTLKHYRAKPEKVKPLK